MNTKIENLKNEVIKLSQNPNFIHHKWFVEFHLEIVENIALSLCDKYHVADKDIVRVMVWMHDYGKIIDFDNQHEKTISEGKGFMKQFDFPDEFINKIISNIDILDKKIKIEKENIEIQIVSNADGASHFFGPFHAIHWWENHDKSLVDLMRNKVNKLEKDWYKKITLPEVKKIIEPRYLQFRETFLGELPDLRHLFDE